MAWRMRVLPALGGATSRQRWPRPSGAMRSIARPVMRSPYGGSPWPAGSSKLPSDSSGSWADLRVEAGSGNRRRSRHRRRRGNRRVLHHKGFLRERRPAPVTPVGACRGGGDDVVSWFSFRRALFVVNSECTGGGPVRSAASVSPKLCAVQPVSASGAMAVCVYGFIARADFGALDLLAAGGRRFGSPRRHRCPTSTSRWGFVRRSG